MSRDLGIKCLNHKCDNLPQVYTDHHGSFSYCKDHIIFENNSNYEIRINKLLYPYLNSIFINEISNIILEYIYEFKGICQYSLPNQSCVISFILPNDYMINSFSDSESVCIWNLNTRLCTSILFQLKKISYTRDTILGI